MLAESVKNSHEGSQFWASFVLQLLSDSLSSALVCVVRALFKIMGLEIQLEKETQQKVTVGKIRLVV